MWWGDPGVYRRSVADEQALFKSLRDRGFLRRRVPAVPARMRLLQHRDRDGQIRFTDIDAPEFDPATVGKSREDLMARIHARLPDGTWLESVEVFRQLYTRLGFGFLVRLTRLPVITQLLDWGYGVFARNRLRLTGRCTSDLCAIVPASVPVHVSHPVDPVHPVRQRR